MSTVTSQPLDGPRARPDSATVPQPALRLSVPLVLGIATVLGFFSTFQAANMMLVSGETPQVPVLIGLNLSYWWL